jgi:Protein of unknown function (DUF3168)
MSLGESLFSYLVAQPAVNTLLGTRIRPLRLPQQPTLPAATYQMVSRSPVHVRPGLVKPVVMVRVQIDVYTQSYSQAYSVAQVLKAALYDFQAGSPWVYDAKIEGEQDFMEAEIEQYRRSLDVIIVYAEE